MCDHEARAAPPTASGSGSAHLDAYAPPASSAGSSSAAAAAANGSNTFPGSGTVPWSMLSHASHVPSPLSQGESVHGYGHSQAHDGSGSSTSGDVPAHTSPQHSPVVSAPPHGSSFSAWTSAFSNDEGPRSHGADGVALLSEAALASSQAAATSYAGQAQQAISRTASPERAPASAGRGMPMPAASYSQAPPTASINPAMLVGTQYAPLLLQNQQLQQRHHQQQQEHMQRQQQQYHLQQRMQQQAAQQAQQLPPQEHAQYGQEQEQQQPDAFQNGALNGLPPVGLSVQDEALFNQLRESPLLGHYLRHTFGDVHRRIEAVGRHNDEVRLMLQNQERTVTAQRVEVNSLAAEQRRWAAEAEEWSLLRTHELDAWEQRLAHRSLLLMQRENAVGLRQSGEGEQARAEALVMNHSSFLQQPMSSGSAPPLRRSSALQERGQNGSSMPSVNSPPQPEQEVVEPPLKKKRASPKTRGTATTAKRGSTRAPRVTKAQKAALAAQEEKEATAAAVALAAVSAATPAGADQGMATRTRAAASPLFSPRPAAAEKEFAGTAFAGAGPLGGSAAPSASPPASASTSAQR